jgi:hypothetical protein
VIEHPSESLIANFAEHPEVVKRPFSSQSDFFDENVVKTLTPSRMVEYEPAQLEGIANILLNSTMSPSLNSLLFLSTALANSELFDQLLEQSSFTPPELLYATGEASKVVIKTPDAGQRLYAAGLQRNAAYLAHSTLQTTPLMLILRYSAFCYTSQTISFGAVPFQSSFS